MTYKFLKTSIKVVSKIQLHKNERFYFFWSTGYIKRRPVSLLCFIPRPCISTEIASKIKIGTSLKCRGELLRKSSNDKSDRKYLRYYIFRVKYIGSEELLDYVFDKHAVVKIDYNIIKNDEEYKRAHQIKLDVLNK